MVYIREFFTWILNSLFHLTEVIGFPSYALALILISVIVKIILYPLTLKQMKSSLGMQEIQPKMLELQKKYKNNPEKLNKAMSELYKEHEVKPMAGCLPLLIQLPILYGLFSAIRNFEFTNPDYATFFWVPNLAERDPYFVLPILVAGSMFLQQKLTMGATMNDNPSMKMMMYFMPLMIGFMSIQFPSGLCIYWVMFSIMGIVQQYFINKSRKKELEAREARLEAQRAEREKAKEENQKKQAPNKKKKPKQPKPRAEYIRKTEANKKAEDNDGDGK